VMMRRLVLSVAVSVVLIGCGGPAPPTPSVPTSPEPPPAPPNPAPEPAPVPDATLVGAGDIVKCNAPEAEQTAKLLDRIPGTVVALGDTVYPSATPALLSDCYGPTWGRHLSRTLAVAGNHDWEASGGAPFFAYFAQAAGPPGRGYFSTSLGSWHVIVLNSNVSAAPGSPQYTWLQSDLAASTAPCTVAMWHHPLFTSGANGNSPQMREVWRLLMSTAVDVVLNGHDHDYERFAPQDADGRAAAQGMREFVTGTGGASLTDRITPQANSEVRDNRTFGVLRLTLKATSYDWRFVSIDGQTFTDAGSAPCITR